MAYGRKRSRADYEGVNMMGVSDTLTRMRDDSPGSAGDDTVGNSQPAHDTADADGGGWQKVERRKKKPKKENDTYPSISHSWHSRLQSFVKIGDLQNLILYMLADGTAPQWCSVRHHANVNKVVTLMVPGLEAGMFDGKIPLTATSVVKPEERNVESDQVKEETSNGVAKVQLGKARIAPDDYYPTKLKKDHLPEPLVPFADIFDHLWPIKTPGDDKYAKLHSPMAAFLSAPIVKSKDEKKFKGPRPPSASRGWQNHRTPVTELLASTEQIKEEGYALHPAHFDHATGAEAEIARRVASKTSKADGWVDMPNIPSLSAGNVPDEEIERGSVTAGRKVLAMDCEMCITSPQGQTPQVFSLTRVSFVDWDGNVVLDEYVKPAEPITDYLTPYSGITPAHLENVTTTLSDIQQKLNSIITPQTILVGHSMNSDLNALRITHPFLIDTTLLFPHPRGPPLKSSLKWLAQKYLAREIQKGHGSTGHNSIEDARACLDLVKQKCEKGKAWGTSEASAESIFTRLARSRRPKRQMVNPSGDEEPRFGAVVDWGDPTKGYGGSAKVAIGCESDDEVVAGIKRVLIDAESDKTVPQGGCDFTWARFRELEAHRGWWDQSKGVDAEALRATTVDRVAKQSLEDTVKQTVARISDIYNALPPCTALVIYSGSADPRELREMTALQQQFKEEYKVKKWDQLSVKWTDVEEQKMRKACETARRGIGLITVK